MNCVPEEIVEVYRTAECLFSRQEVEQIFDQMALEITEILADTNPILLCVMVGGVVLAGNLLTRLNFLLEVDYIHATRYETSTKGKEITWKAMPRIDLKDRTVIVVDDILDGGVTLQHIIEYCYQQQCAQVYTVVLVDKQNARQKNGLVKADITGLLVDNHYVFGYGMDYKGYFRNAPGIFKIDKLYE